MFSKWLGHTSDGTFPDVASRAFCSLDRPVLQLKPKTHTKKDKDYNYIIAKKKKKKKKKMKNKKLDLGSTASDCRNIICHSACLNLLVVLLFKLQCT